MAANPTPDSQDVLVALVEDMIDGLHDHEDSVGVEQNTEEVMLAALGALTDAEDDYAVAKGLTAQKAALIKAADADGEEWLAKAAKLLRIALGERWNMQWEATHFPDQSTQVPGTQDKRFTLLGKLATYFTNNPAHTAPNQDVTAAKAAALHTALSNARDIHGDTETAQNSAKNARDIAERKLRKRVRSLISELGTVLSDDDPRWDLFGLSRPSDPDTPLPASALTVTPAGPGALLCKWKRGKRAERYRIFAQVLTVDPEPVNVETVKDLSHTLENLPAGQTVEVHIIAANEAGEAEATETVAAVVG